MIFQAYKNTISRFVRVKPTNLALLVTERCNARCMMCNIWKDGFTNGPELTLAQYDDLLKSAVFSDIVNLMLSGGEALLRKDVAEIIRAALKRLPRLKRITIATNGLATDLITQKISQIASELSRESRSIRLIAQVSFDAISVAHDQIRGPDASSKVKSTIDKLVAIREGYKLFGISAGCVIQPMNICEIEDVFDYLNEKNIESIFTVICNNEHYYGNSNEDEIFFTEKDNKQLSDILKTIALKEKNLGKKFLYMQFRSMLSGGENHRGCPALRDTLTINPDGTIPPCLNACDKSLGNVLQKDVEEIWFSNSTVNVIRNINVQRCNSCMFACGVGYSEVLGFLFRTLWGRRLGN